MGLVRPLRNVLNYLHYRSIGYDTPWCLRGERGLKYTAVQICRPYGLEKVFNFVREYSKELGIKLTSWDHKRYMKSKAGRTYTCAWNNVSIAKKASIDDPTEYIKFRQMKQKLSRHLFEEVCDCGRH